MPADLSRARHPEHSGTNDAGWSVVKMYAPREKLYVRDVKGRYTNWRRACAWLTQLVYYGLPWLSWNGRPAVLFDLVMHKFYLFGLILWPQDFIYLAGLLILCACLLFFSSAAGGRVWCSYACPHTVYSGIFMWIEHKIEGGRGARMRIDAAPLSLSKTAKKLGKHGAWIVLAAWTGITLVGYFTPIRILIGELAAFSSGSWESFWICFYGGLAYLNAGWMREQFCKYICAYARFQSVMFDQDTLTISYDPGRGEPRGLRRRNRDPSAPRQGDCVDCTICVQVCPAGIDIRNGFQYECIDCAACIDACDAVMDKLGMARGLIRYSTANALAQGLSAQQIRRRVLRPRVLIYGGALGAGLALIAAALALRPPLKLDVMADRGAMGRLSTDGMIENVYRLQVMNTEEHLRRVQVDVSGMDTITLADEREFEIGPAAARLIPLRVRAVPGAGHTGANRIVFTLHTIDGASVHLVERSMFYISPDS